MLVCRMSAVWERFNVRYYVGRGSEDKSVSGKYFIKGLCRDFLGI